jgi:amino acid adenylation domain-containing protein
MTHGDRSRDTLPDYLRGRLASPPPASTWPADLARPEPRAGEARGLETVPFSLPAGSADALDRLASRLDVPPLALLAASLQLLFFRVSSPWEGAEAGEVVIGAGTSRSRPGEWLPLRHHVDPAEPAAELIARAGAELREVLAHQEHSAPYPVGRLASDLGIAPDELCRGLLFAGSGPAGRGVFEDFGLAPDVVLSLDPADGYRGQLEYSPVRYSPECAERIAAGFGELLSGIARDPRTPSGKLRIVPPGRNAPEGNAPQGGAVAAGLPAAHELFDRAASRHPDVPALRWDGGELSYAELREAADRCAAALGTPRLVALSGPRSPELVIALLAILKAGAGYVPLDPAYPAERLDFMLADSGAEVLICPRDLAARFTVPTGVRIVDLGIVPGPDGPPAERLPRAQSQDLCYVIYTSGSTGLPKGVRMPHRPLASLLDWQARNSAATTGWRTLQFVAFSFDVAFQEIFATWSTGGTLVLVGDDVRRDPSLLLGYLIEQRIQRFFAPFVAIQQLAETAVRSGRFPCELREVITAGEQLHVSPAIREFFLRTGASLENQYGPSETHVVTAERLAPDPADWPELPPIGKPVDRAIVEILDAGQQPLPVGVPGEICVSGTPLADGYTGRPELIAERFVRRDGGTGRIYLTGDFGRLLDGGRIEYLGRKDGQVKIRGLRVELGEIEARLKAQVGLADAVVIVQESATRGKQLYAYYLLVPGSDVPPKALRRSLGLVLPPHMIPSAFVALVGFPLTPSGKVDRRALAARPLPTDPDVAYQAVLERAAESSRPGRTPGAPLREAPIQQVVAEVWAEALCRDTVDINADLFASGGNSRTALEVAAELSEIFQVEVPARLMFDLPTVADQSAYLVETDLSCAHSLVGIAQRLLDYEVTLDDAVD